MKVPSSGTWKRRLVEIFRGPSSRSDAGESRSVETCRERFQIKSACRPPSQTSQSCATQREETSFSSYVFPIAVDSAVSVPHTPHCCTTLQPTPSRSLSVCASHSPGKSAVHRSRRTMRSAQRTGQKIKTNYWVN